MLTGLLHRVVARPWVYDLVQTMAGAKQVRARLAAQIAPLRTAPLVLDIGGGTGSIGEFWSKGSKYVCLDLDALKLAGFTAKNPRGVALQADATRIPIVDGAIDVVLCTNVTHHLPDVLLDRMIAESARVLKPGGRFVLADATWSPDRRVSRLLWKYDRGSSPRTAAMLRENISRHFVIERWEQLAVWHEYVICVAGQKRGGSRMSKPAREITMGAKTFTIREALVGEIIPLRHRMLRQGLPIAEAMFDGDDEPATRHFAVVEGDEVVGCASFVLNVWESVPAWQLRGMAVDSARQRSGLGAALLSFAVEAVREASAVHLFWCNARVPALEFYRRQGWEAVSEQFEIPTAGPHRKMVLRA